LKLFARIVCLLSFLGSAGAWASAPSVVADAQIALASGFSYPQGIAVSSKGTVYVADTGNNRVVTVSSTGVVTPVSTTGFTLSAPGAVAVDTSGNLYIADSYNARVLEVPVTGSPVPVIAGAPLSLPISVAVGSNGVLYVGDANNNAVYKVSGGIATKITIANATNIFPQALATDASNNLYIADGNSGFLYEVAPGASTAQNVTPAGFTLNSPAGLGLDVAGDLYVLDSGNSRIIEVPVPTSSQSYEVPITGLAVASSLALDPSGNLYVTDVTHGNVTQLIYAGNAVNLGTVAVGSTGPAVAVNYELNAAETLTAFKITMQGDSGQEATVAAGTTCQFQSYADAPTGSSNPIAPSNPFLCLANIKGFPAYSGTRNGVIQLLGSSSAILSNVPFVESGSGAVPAIFPGVTSTAVSGLTEPQGFAISAQDGTVYIANADNGVVYSWKGLNSGNPALTSVATAPLTLNTPTDVVLDGAGDLFIADYGAAQVVVVPANPAIAPYQLNAGSLLQHPTSLTMDRSGNLYIGDSGPLGINATAAQPGKIVKVLAAGLGASVVNTSPVTIVFPQNLVTDAAGNLYVGDGGPASGPGQIVLVPQNGSAASVLSLPVVSDPGGLAIDPAGQLYILDSGNLAQLTVVPPGNASSYTLPINGSGLLAPSKMALTADAKNFLVSDIGTDALVFLSASQAQLTFPTTALNTPTPAQTATILNIGNLALAPSNPAGGSFSYNGNLQDFQVQSSSTCLGFTQLAPTGSCLFSALFDPVSAGVESESITSILNSAHQVQLLLAGTTTNASSVTATPSISPNSGTYVSAQTVTITDTASGAVIYYTLDGSTPTTSSAVYHTPFPVTGSTMTTTTVNAIAVASGLSASPVATATYTFNPYLGTNAYSTAGTDTANYINATYAVTGNDSGGYTVTSCSFYQPTGTVTSGAKIDCGLVPAPTPTTQASSWLCHATYTNPSAAGVGGWITLTLSGCGTLPPGHGYWISTDNNDPLIFPYGFWNCGSACNGSAPTVANGTYPYRAVAATYGVYTGMSTAMSATGSVVQASQYVELAPNTSLMAAAPTFSPASGSYIPVQSVTISDTATGAVIYYTLDGSMPSTASAVYHSPLSISAATTINAIAVAPGYTTSTVGSATYTFNPYLGTNAYSTAGTDSANYINATYAVTGNDSGGYTVTSCGFYQPTGTVTSGAKIDCGVVLAPTPTTQSSSWLCHATYTNPGSSGVGAWISVPLSGCGTLPPGKAYWISTDTNDTRITPYGFWNCGSTCNGSVPTVGTGTYYYSYIAATYGVYTGMSTAMNGSSGNQGSQYVALTPNAASTAATPAFSPGTGTYFAAQSVTISDSTTGAVIYYTTNGTTPTTNSAVYSSAIPVSATTTINAIAVAPGYTNSAMGSAVYTFTPYLGTPSYSTASTDYAGYINAAYAVTGSNAHGYTVNTCVFYQPTGSVTSGAKIDCGLVAAPTPTTQASSWLCHGTYTNPTASGAGAWITVTLSGCGTLPAGAAYWIATDGNDPHVFPYGNWNCGGTCNGSAPTVGTGTYPYYYIAAPYGVYTGMATAMSRATTQASQYVTLTVVP
jgi:sugar lactone lactonase YvrE